MTQYWTNDYSDPMDIASALEDAKSQIDDAINALNNFEDAEDAIADAALEQSHAYKTEVVDTLESIAAFNKLMFEWADDTSDLYKTRRILDVIVTLMTSHEQAPYRSQYTMACKIYDALNAVRNERDAEIGASTEARSE
jgi:hypothetical protein